MTSAKRALLYLLLRLGYVMCQREYLISRIFKLLLVLLKGAYFPRIAVSHKCFRVVLMEARPGEIRGPRPLVTALNLCSSNNS